MRKRNGHDLATVLLEKARGDESALRKLLDAEDVPQEALGFHAQQAVEKLLKAVLAEKQIRYEFSHDLGYLLELMKTNGLKPPAEAEDLEWLTPWATEFRYEDPANLDPFEAQRALTLIDALRTWCRRMVDDGD